MYNYNATHDTGTLLSIYIVLPFMLFMGPKKLKRVKIFSWLKRDLQQIKIRLQKRKEWLNLPFT